MPAVKIISQDTLRTSHMPDLGGRYYNTKNQVSELESLIRPTANTRPHRSDQRSHAPVFTKASTGRLRRHQFSVAVDIPDLMTNSTAGNLGPRR